MRSNRGSASVTPSSLAAIPALTRHSRWLLSPPRTETARTGWHRLAIEQILTDSDRAIVRAR
eukprot:1528184-Prymnesium_polylepis.1